MEIKEQLKQERDTTDIKLPPVIFGTSGLGNLFVAADEQAKFEIIKECFRSSKGPIVFDTAGKYGAGLALEVLGRCLKMLDISPDQVTISNKLAWVRTKLRTPEPTFEPGVWKDLKYDAIQKISYHGIMECFEQGNQLLNGYIPQMVSIHDPDEYLAAAKDKKHEQRLYNDILNGYRALYDLKEKGKVKAVGIGAKDWKVIRRIAADVPFDWVMIANSMTIKNHPRELIDLMLRLQQDGVAIVNAAVFHSGFLTGSDYFDYKLVTRESPEGEALYKWRSEFFALCKEFEIAPAAACIQFGLRAPGVSSIALSTTDASRIKDNIDMVHTEIPLDFWTAMKEKGLISVNVSR